MNNLFLWLIFLKAGEESNFIIIISNNHISHKINNCKRHPIYLDNFQGRNISLRLLKQFSSVGSPLSTSSGSSPPHTSPSENKEYSTFFSKFGRGKNCTLFLLQTCILKKLLIQKMIFKSIRFVKGAMNIVDLLGILPYFMSLVLQLVTNEKDSVVSFHSFCSRHWS